eukprot:897609-Rhodomonas_salina.1
MASFAKRCRVCSAVSNSSALVPSRGIAPTLFPAASSSDCSASTSIAPLSASPLGIVGPFSLLGVFLLPFVTAPGSPTTRPCFGRGLAVKPP